MPFTFDDFLQKIGGKDERTERFSEQASGVKAMTQSELKSLFPNVKLENSDSVVYFPFQMCQSLPAINEHKEKIVKLILNLISKK